MIRLGYIVLVTSTVKFLIVKQIYTVIAKQRSRIRYLSKNNSGILTNIPKFKKFVKMRTKIR